jgi:hypothetical protein
VKLDADILAYVRKRDPADAVELCEMVSRRFHVELTLIEAMTYWRGM